MGAVHDSVPKLEPSHRFLEHIGEIAMELEAPSLAELFEEAARGLCELMAERPPRVSGEAFHVSVTQRDLASLLVAWLDELIYLGEVHKVVFPEARIVSIDEHTLEAFVRGASPPQLRTAVKAATLHGLAVSHDEHGARAKVVLDV